MTPLLDGILVVEVGSVVLGPCAAQILGDFGAEVIKVEPLDGDIARSAHPRGEDGGALFVNNNRNKKSIAIDLKQPEGKEVLDRLVCRADVLLHNMRWDAARRLGLDFETVRKANQQIIHCAASGFGRGGRYRNRPAFDDIIQAASGLAGLPSRTGEDPRFIPTNVADKVAALYTAQSILAALVARRSGHTEAIGIEIPMFEAVVSFLMNEHLGAATFDLDGEPGYPRILSSARGPYRTSDGWLAVLPYTTAQWRRFLREAGKAEICEESWFADSAQRQAQTATLYRLIGEVLPERTTAEWMAALDPLDIPCSEVRNLEDLFEDPHLQDIDFFRPPPGYPAEICRVAPQPAHFSGVSSAPDRPPPQLGADTHAVLAQCGVPQDEIDRLVETGIVRSGPAGLSPPAQALG